MAKNSPAAQPAAPKEEEPKVSSWETVMLTKYPSLAPELARLKAAPVPKNFGGGGASLMGRQSDAERAMWQMVILAFAVMAAAALARGLG